MTDAIENPWADLTEYKGKIFAKCDKEDLERFSKIVDLEGSGERLDDETKLHLELLPEPCIGNPAKAAFIYIAINPGFTKGDEVAFKYYEDTIRKNLENESSRTMYWVDTEPKFTSSEGNEYENAPRKWYFGNPGDAKSEALAGGKLQHLLFALSYKGSFEELHNELQKERGLDPQTAKYWEKVRDEVLKNRSRDQAHEIMRNHVAVIDAFPYHSKNAKFEDSMFEPAGPSEDGTGLESRHYTAQLVRNAINNKARIMMPQGLEYWLSLVPELAGYVDSNRLFTSSSKRNKTFTANNVRELRRISTSGSDLGLARGEKNAALFWDTVDYLLETWRSTTTNDL